ncbi:MAG: DUF58 domain-containing protein [Armatimonadetes bacterium]|nr:DUF58 domain-containing protein [Armatimonadota bacterium]
MEFGKKHVLIWGSVFLLLVGMVLSIHQLYVMFAVLALLAPAAYLMSRGAATHLSVTRAAPGVLREGQQQQVRLYISNEGLRRCYLFTVADRLPEGLQVTGPAATLVEALAADEQVQVTYTLRAQRRGVYTIGPVELRHSDPIGLFTFTRLVGPTDELVVHPSPEPIPDSWTRAGSLRAMQHVRRRFRGEGTEFYGTRRYLPGDDLRRVDWKSTARRGHMIVREYERAEATDCTIVLDLHRSVHSGEGDDSTLERGVKLAASVAAQMTERGSHVGLVAAGAQDWSRPAGADPRQRTRIFDALARVQADGDAPLGEQISSHRPLIPEGSMMVVISPLCSVEAVTLATTLIREGYALVWLIPAAPWRAPRDDEMTEDQLAARLNARGARAYVIAPGRPLSAGMRGGHRVA